MSPDPAEEIGPSADGLLVPPREEPWPEDTLEDVLGDSLEDLPTLGRVAIAVGRLLWPIVHANREQADGLAGLLSDARLDDVDLSDADWDRLEDASEAVESAFENVETLLEAEGDLGDLPTVLDALDELETGLGCFGDLDEIDAGEAFGDLEDVESSEFGSLLFEYLFVEYLATYRGEVYGVLSLLGIIEVRVDEPTSIDLDRLADTFTDVNEIPAAVHDWGEETFRVSLVLECIERICLDADALPDSIDQALGDLADLAGVEDLEDLPGVEELAAFADVEDVADLADIVDLETIEDLADLVDFDTLGDVLAAADLDDLDDLGDLESLLDLVGLESLSALFEQAGIESIEDFAGVEDLEDLADAFGLDDLLDVAEFACLDELDDLLELAEIDAFEDLIDLADLDDLTDLVDLADLDDLDDLSELADLDDLDDLLAVAAPGELEDIDDFVDLIDVEQLEDFLDVLELADDLEDLEDLADLAGAEDVSDFLDAIGADGIDDAVIDDLEDLADLDDVDLDDVLAELDLADLATRLGLTDLVALIELADLETVLDLVELAESVDLEDALEWIDLEDLADVVDLADLASLIGLEDLAEEVPLEDVLALLEGEALGDAVDLEDLAELVPLEDLAAMIGLEDLLDLPDASTLTDRDVVIPIPPGAEEPPLELSLVPIPGTGDGWLPGLAAIFAGEAELAGSTTVEIDDDWRFEFDASADADVRGTAIRLRPGDGGVDIDLVGVDDDVEIDLDAAIRLRAALVGEFDGDDGELVLVGDEGASRLALYGLSAEGRLEVTDEGGSVDLAAPTSGVIAVEPDVFDGFLRSVLPGDGLEHEFEVAIGWSSDEGLYLDKRGTLDTSIPLNESVGPSHLQELFLSIGAWAGEELAEATPADADSSSIAIAGALTGTVQLGPITGTVERMGIEGEISFPEDGDGEFGPLDVDVRIKPPEGMGLAIDATGVGGGGYLDYDHDEGRYAGVLQLTAGTLTINAVGLLTTQLPDGSDGFSLLVIISGEFEPIQLGFGFTLNGIGGLLGIHRSMQTDPLRDAVRDGRVDSVLFPDDPVGDAPRIISDLRSFFPPSEGDHVFGPMAILGWGTPSIITADLGVILEIPSVQLAILGRITMGLPSTEIEPAPVLVQMDVLGVIDIPGKEITIDAALFDSHVVTYDLTGEMALRARWGEDSQFLLSVGGFNPRYDPPGELADMKRARMSMSDPLGVYSVEFQGYFALTSNTVQAGAGISVQYEIGPGRVYGEFQFDALIQFDPFQFAVDLRAEVGAELSKVGSVSLTLRGTLTGPSPYHLTGEIDLPWPLGDASVCAEFGDDESLDSLPAADVLSKLLEELEEPGNWSAQRPRRGATYVTLRETDDPGTVKVHPLGTIEVRQTITPLSTRIEVFGEARPEPYTRFELTDAQLTGESGGLGADPAGTSDLKKPEAIEEQFAPADFEDLTEDERFERDAYEWLPAGTAIESGALVDGSELDAACQRKFLYKTVIEDEECDNLGVLIGHLPGTIDSLRSSAGRGFNAPLEEAIEAEKYTSDAIKEELIREEFDLGGFLGDDPTTGPESPSGQPGRVNVGSDQPVAATSFAEWRPGLGPAFEDEANAPDLDEPTAGFSGEFHQFDEDAAMAAGDDDPTWSAAMMRSTAGPGTHEAGESSGRGDRPGPRSDPEDRPRRFGMNDPEYVIVDARDLSPVAIPDGPTGPVSKSAAKRALNRHVRDHPEDADRLRVVERSRASDHEAIAL